MTPAGLQCLQAMSLALRLPRGCQLRRERLLVRMVQVTKEEMLDAEPLDSYVLVRREDVLEAIGSFVAAYLAELPEAQNLQPAQLQAALKTTFKV